MSPPVGSWAVSRLGGAFPCRTRALWAALAILGAQAAPLHPQVPADPILSGRVFVGGEALTSGTVVLHHLTADSQGDVDSTTVDDDGTFSFRLPQVPDPERSDVYFASVRHHGVLYFGKAITLPIQLDSVYEIQAYDTAVVGPEAAQVRVQVRNLFMEEEGGRWTVTDLVQVLNEGDRTFVAPDDGAVWSYPLTLGAEEFTLGQSDVAPDGAAFENGAFVVRSPIPPGERLYVMRYVVPDPYLEVPTPGDIELLEVLVREPAPPLLVPGLTAVDRVELESGSTYRRFVGENVSGDVLRVIAGREVRVPPVEWMAVILALLLAGVGVSVLTRIGPDPAAAGDVQGAASSPTLIVEIAKLDERFEAAADTGDPSEYRRMRAALLRRLRQER